MKGLFSVKVNLFRFNLNHSAFFSCQLGALIFVNVVLQYCLQVSLLFVDLKRFENEHFYFYRIVRRSEAKRFRSIVFQTNDNEDDQLKTIRHSVDLENEGQRK